MLARLLYGFRCRCCLPCGADRHRLAAGHPGAVARLFWRAHRFDFAKADRNLGLLPELYLLIIFARCSPPARGCCWPAVAVWLDGPIRLCARRISAQPAKWNTCWPPAGPVQQRHHVAAHPAQQPHPGDHVFAFRISGAILALTSLDFSAWACPPPPPAWANCWRKAKTTSTPGGGDPPLACWVGTLVLLIFIGEALREAADTRGEDGMTRYRVIAWPNMPPQQKRFVDKPCLLTAHSVSRHRPASTWRASSINAVSTSATRRTRGERRTSDAAPATRVGAPGRAGAGASRNTGSSAARKCGKAATPRPARAATKWSNHCHATPPAAHRPLIQPSLLW